MPGVWKLQTCLPLHWILGKTTPRKIYRRVKTPNCLQELQISMFVHILPGVFKEGKTEVQRDVSCSMNSFPQGWNMTPRLQQNGSLGKNDRQLKPESGISVNGCKCQETVLDKAKQCVLRGTFFFFHGWSFFPFKDVIFLCTVFFLMIFRSEAQIIFDFLSHLGFRFHRGGGFLSL